MSASSALITIFSTWLLTTFILLIGDYAIAGAGTHDDDLYDNAGLAIVFISRSLFLRTSCFCYLRGGHIEAKAHLVFPIDQFMEDVHLKSLSRMSTRYFTFSTYWISTSSMFSLRTVLPVFFL